MDNQERRDSQLIAYKLRFPQDLDIANVNEWLRAASGTLQPRRKWLPRAVQSLPTMVFETWGQPNGISWRLLVPWQYERIAGQLEAYVPGISVMRDDEFPRRRWTKAEEAGVVGTSRTFDLGDVSSTARQVLNEMGKVQTNEALVMQWVVTPAPREHLPVQGEARSDQLSLRAMAKGQHMANKDEINARREKLKEPNYQAVLRMAAYANTEPRADDLLLGVKSAFKGREAAGITFRKRTVSKRELQFRMDNASTPKLSFPAQLSITELACFVGFPLGSLNLPGMPPPVARQIVPVDAVPRDGRGLGMSNYTGRERPVALSFKDALTHQWVCGSTGSGKTVLLENNAIDDITAGHGLLLIEAKGDLYNGVLGRIPANRQKDVIILDFTNGYRPVGLNFLDQGHGEHVIDGVTAMFDGMYNSKGGVWSKKAFYYGLKVLKTAKAKYSLIDLAMLLDPADEQQMEWAMSIAQEASDRDAGEEILKHLRKPEPKRKQEAQPVLDRVWEFNKPRLKNVLGQTDSSFQFSDAVRENKIILVNLAGVEPNTRDLIGAMIFNQYWQAVQEVKTPPRPNFCYMDEFQCFVGAQADFGDVLARSRSFGLGLVIANQYVGQLPSPLQDALMRNAKTKVVFNAAGDEARRFESEFAPLVSRDDIATLGSYTAVVKVAQNGSVLPPFTMKTNAPGKPNGNSAKVKGDSLSRYGRDAADVEREIVERRQAEAPTSRRTSDERFRLANDWAD